MILTIAFLVMLIFNSLGISSGCFLSWKSRIYLAIASFSIAYLSFEEEII